MQPPSVCSQVRWFACAGAAVWGHFLAAQVLCASEPAPPSSAAVAPSAATVVSLDSADWQLAVDPRNVGRDEAWFKAPRAEAKRSRVPWIIQDAFPGYHGLAWYWREFVPPLNPHARGRSLLRFWAVDYAAQVWLNGQRVGEHEDGETPFLLDVTDALTPGATNLLAVRVLNPTHEAIDGIVLNETPHRNKALPYSAGSAWDQGGIIDSVELFLAPAVRLEDLFVRPDWKTGVIEVQASLHNSTSDTVRGQIELSLAPAASGETLAVTRLAHEARPGSARVTAQLRVAQPRLWELNDPFLYRVTARLTTEAPTGRDEQSVRCGFRDFRFANGAFRLNGRRLYLRCSHTGNCCPIGLELPHDPDLLRRDLLNAKVMRFNAIRFIAGVAKRYQLDLCDEIGLLVYEESYAGWCLADSPKMPERYARSVLGMVGRDRNHPSVVAWGLLNETPEGAVFQRAVGLLPTVRELDPSRLVLVNSGRWDSQGGDLTGLEAWRAGERTDPCVTRNGATRTLRALGITWAPGQMSFHPGAGGEYAAVRWTAPAELSLEVDARFASIAERATTDVHLLHNGRALFTGCINVRGASPECRYQTNLSVKAGDRLDCCVGFGNGDYGADTTALAVRLRTASGQTYDAAADFSSERNPNGAWSYGQLPPGPTPDPSKFVRFGTGWRAQAIGSVSNPGSSIWENLLSDRHPYQRVPHTAGIIHALRTLGEGGLPVFVSEYGVGSAVDLLRVIRHYEQLGKPEVEDARFYRAQRDQFLADWQRWRLSEAFDRPEDFFAQSNARMAGQRLLGINAIRANTNVVGYSLTGTVDQGMTGEGLWTTFREFKPGTADALFDGFAPLRWCLFAEPVHLYRGAPVRLEAVLANEDALAPGEYPVRLEVVGPGATRVFARNVTVTIPPTNAGAEPPMVLPVFAESVTINGPAGVYRFLATFEQGAAAAGEAIEFHVTDPALMPPVPAEVVLWGADAGLAHWLADHGIRARPFALGVPAQREVILASGAAPAPGGAAAFAELARHIARGSVAVFLTPGIFAKGDQPTAWVPLIHKGALAGLPSWLYHKDEWSKPHLVFEGLPAGGLLDYAYYRELIPDQAWVGQDPPAEAVAGGINAAQGYSAGLFIAVHELGAGRFVLNTMPIRPQLGLHPAADRLLRNLLRYASRAAAAPVAELPADFNQRLGALGYIE